MSKVIGRAACRFCGYKTTTGAISEHSKHCALNPKNKKMTNDKHNPEKFTYKEPQLSKREKIAAMAMQAFVSQGVSTFDAGRNHEGILNDIARASVLCADTLLKQLES